MEGIRSGFLDNPGMLIGGILVAIGFILFAVLGFAVVGSASGGPPDFTGVLCSWGIGALGLIIMGVSRWMAGSVTIPPPPPVQQPMVPPGTQGPVGLNCPACGAPAENADRFGIATCTHCGTRFLVR